MLVDFICHLLKLPEIIEYLSFIVLRVTQPKGAGMGSTTPQCSAAKRGVVQTARYKCF